MNDTNQGPCQSRQTAENIVIALRLGDFANQLLAHFAKHAPEHSPRPARRVRERSQQELIAMIGKLFGAWLGNKVAGEHEGAKGAMLGYGAAALAKRSVPTLAALALGGWAFKKWRERRRSEPSHPSDASPS
jgi:hypothetical protein